jgi:hypothetical protein
MNSKPTVLGVCTLLALIVIVVIMSVDRQRRVAERSKTQLLVAPDGTISVPRNDNMQIVAEVSAFDTNASAHRRLK